MKSILTFTALSFIGITAHAASLVVPATTNIFGAGHTAPNDTPAPSGGGGGTAPLVFNFTAQPGQVLTFSSVSGTVQYSGSVGATGPDGGISSLNIFSFNGIAGITAPVLGHLSGVFLDSTEPTDPSPARLNFTTLGTNFTTLAPLLRQVFFIGDGLTGTGTGAIQQFQVPSTATRLYLGFADGIQTDNLPGGYANNTGTVSATFQIVPEPTTLTLVSAIATAACGLSRRRSLRTHERNG